MKKLSALWRHVTSKQSLQIGDRADNSGGLALKTRAFVKTFNSCPICDQDFVDHYLSMLSVVPADKGEVVSAVMDKVKNHQWTEAREFREFEPSQDALEIYVLRCPSRRLGVVIIEDPFDLYHNPSILDYEVLDESQSEELRAVVVGEQWLSIK